MMEIELPPYKPTQKEIDLIDILWKQDIDLGVGREVFDYNQRQKDYELEKQKKLEKEHQEQLQKEQEKALFAHLQLDEETGEFIPIQQTAPLQAPQPITSALQNKPDLEQGFSFDECIKILADTFQFEEHEIPYQPTLAPNPNIAVSQTFLPTEQVSVTVSLPATANNMPEVEQAWEELLSIPELQYLNQINDFGDISMYANQGPVMDTPQNYVQEPVMETPRNYVQDPVMETPQNYVQGPVMDTPQNYMFSSPMPALEEPVSNIRTVFSNDFTAEALGIKEPLNTDTTLNVESFCDDIFALVDPKATNVPFVENVDKSLTKMLSESVDLKDLAMCKAFNGNNPSDFNDSDSGISLNTSPCATSPEQSMGSSMCGDNSYNYSDSETEDMDSTPEGVQHPAEPFPTTFTEEVFFSLSPFVSTDPSFETEMYNSPKKELPVRPGPSESPFMKDKSLSRLEARFTRDEQRAKALNVPFSVDNIVNLPVEDFNTLMSKHQFNDAQLALIRDIRRRGKNKVAAQNCRKRKMENIVELENDLDQLKYQKEKLLAEKGEYNNSLSLLKKQLGSLYMEVFNKLRDEDGKPYSPQEYSLQQTKDGNVFLVPKAKRLEIKREQN